MAENGFIKLFRSITKWEWYKDGNTKAVFIHLLLMANYEDKQWRGNTIKRGQLACSYSNLALETGLTVKKVRTALDHLISSGEVAYDGRKKYGVITVKNFDKFQYSTPKEANEGQAEGTQKADEGQTKGIQRATTKEIKNKRIKKTRIDIPPLPPKGETADFERPEKIDFDLQAESLAIEKDLTVKEVIDFLNEKAGTNYKSTVGKNRDLIKARQKEGFTLQDFKTVIEVKYSEWGKTDMRKYLRPVTLFGTNFESYLNQDLPQKKAEYKPKEGDIW